MHALVRFAHIAAGNTFSTAEIHPAVIEALGCTPEHYTLASLRYDLSKLRAKGLVREMNLIELARPWLPPSTAASSGTQPRCDLRT
jgi:hypothetical protein